MRRIHHWQLRAAAGVLGTALALGAYGLMPAASAAATASGPVSATPASGTPSLIATSTSNETIRQLVQCGGTMYAVGKFSQISGFNGSSTQTFIRNNAFSFSATAPFKVSAWNPNVNGEVNSIALSSDCSEAYIGGQFTSVGGTTANNLAEISISTGAVNQGFGHSASALVYTVLLTPNGHLLVGGNFKIINNSKAAPYYASVSPATGKNDGYLNNLAISGHYVYPKVTANATSVYNQQLSPDGADVLAEGVFTSVGGQTRQQIFMLSLGASQGSVTGWYSNDFNGFCSTSHPLYVKAAAWSPDGSKVYVATTGFVPDNWNHTFPLAPPNMCDVVAAFSSAQNGGLAPLWTNYSGCDSFFSVAADNFAVYAGGHERWAHNQNACNAQGSGAIPDPGMAGFTPGGGTLLLNSKGTAGRYKMSKANADDMLVTGAGLWIASSDRFNSNQCGGVTGHSGICFLPYS